MEHLKITVRNKEEAQLLADLTRQLKFVVSVDIEEKKELSKGTFSSKEDFLSECGIWKDREVSAETLRKQAWRKIS